MLKKSLVACIVVMLVMTGCTTADKAKEKVKETTETVAEEVDFGVFTGMSASKVLKLKKHYTTMVVDASEFSKKQITALHKKADKIYTYLNIGSIEKNRSYYSKFKSIRIGKYPEWKDEYFVNVANKYWYSYITKTVAKNLKNKGIDGFFIDNCDVYYYKKTKKIYNGLLKILTKLKDYKLPVMINGGDTFVTHALEKKELTGLVNAVCQEDVFTAYNFKTKTSAKQATETSTYYKNYLSKCQEAGLNVFIIEYTKSTDWKSVIKAYCHTHDYIYYCAPSINLDKE